MQILILEPNSLVVSPYSYLASIFRQAVTIQRAETVDHAIESFKMLEPGLVMLSASFEPLEMVRFLEFLKNAGKESIIPLIWVVDLDTPVSTILGTKWAGLTAVSSTLTSLSEFKSIIQRLELEDWAS